MIRQSPLADYGDMPRAVRRRLYQEGNITLTYSNLFQRWYHERRRSLERRLELIESGKMRPDSNGIDTSLQAAEQIRDRLAQLERLATLYSDEPVSRPAHPPGEEPAGQRPDAAD
jgi:hypothetical protein